MLLCRVTQSLLRRCERLLRLPLQGFLTTLVANPDFLATGLRAATPEVLRQVHACCPAALAPVMPHLAMEMQVGRRRNLLCECMSVPMYCRYTLSRSNSC